MAFGATFSPVDDREMVAAIRAGDPRGLANTYDAYGNALFAFCHSMLRDRPAAEDAVQDTFVVLAERVAQLRNPDRLRPWLYAIARSQCLRQLRTVRRVAPTDELADVMDETVDLDAELRSMQLQDLVWHAVEGLNTGERAALELSLRHGLAGEDLAAALGVSRGTCNKLMQRARDELERSLAVLLVSRANEHACDELATLVDGWDGRLTVLMRKRLSRHIERCESCAAQKQHRVSATALLAAVPLLAAPAALRSRVLEHHAMRNVSYDRTLARQVGAFDRDGFPEERAGRRRAIGAAVAVAGIAMAFILSVALPTSAHRVRPLTLSTDGPTALATESTTSTAPTLHAPHRTAEPSSISTPPTTSPGSTALPTGRHSATHVTTPARSKPPPPPTPTLTISPSKLSIPKNGGAQLVLKAVNGSISWTATWTKGLSVDHAGGTLTKNGSITLTVLPDWKTYPSGSATITIDWAGGPRMVSVTW
jgi:RNA polymerase sigma factor (sigma-70 family)